MRNPFFRPRSVTPQEAKQTPGLFERRRKRERLFKSLIILTTGLVVMVLLRQITTSPYVTEKVLEAKGRSARETLWAWTPPAEVTASWKALREEQIQDTRPRVERFYADAPPVCQRLLRYAGMDPEHGLLRWGNYSCTLLLPSKVFEADDEGRSYRLRPRTRAVWLQFPEDLGNSVMTFFLVPDGPGLADILRDMKVNPVEGSQQTTNSWGLRGPEPELGAPVRGLVLGDSFMQGMMIGDDQTPPECLRRYLNRRLDTRVSILNTGVLGYSPEQYYYSLVEFADRFRPHFVVVSVFANDFGWGGDVVNKGVGEWREAKYWLEKIVEHAEARGAAVLIAPVPLKWQLVHERRSGYYPGALFNAIHVSATSVIDPFDDFVNAYLRLQTEARRKGQNLEGCPLFNEPLNDEHFSAAGSEAWAGSVGGRLIRLLAR